MTEEDTFKRLAGPSNLQEAMDIYNSAWNKSLETVPNIRYYDAEKYADAELRKYGWTAELLHQRRYEEFLEVTKS